MITASRMVDPVAWGGAPCPGIGAGPKTDPAVPPYVNGETDIRYQGFVKFRRKPGCRKAEGPPRSRYSPASTLHGWSDGVRCHSGPV